MSKAKQPEQSCGTCKHGRFSASGQYTCYANPPTLIKTEQGVQGFWANVPPDFRGCGKYLYTADVKSLPTAATVSASSTKTN